MKVNALPRLGESWSWSMVASPVRLCQKNIVLARRDITHWLLVEGQGFKELEAADGELRLGEENEMTHGTGPWFLEFISTTIRKRRKSLDQTSPQHDTTAWADLDCAACYHRRWLPAPQEFRNRYQCLMSSCQRQHKGFRNIPPNDQRGEQGAQTKARQCVPTWRSSAYRCAGRREQVTLG